MKKNEQADAYQNQNDRVSYRKRQPRKKRRWPWVVALILVVIVGGMAFLLGRRLVGFTNTIYNRVDRDDMRGSKVALTKGEPVTILLAGIDNGALFYEDVKDGRSDVMMLITINPEKNQTLIASIPRDTLGPMGRTDEFDKLNHAYMNYGMTGTINSLQRWADVPIDHYVEVNMRAFIDVIDGMGGLELTPTQTFTQNGVHFTKGQTQRFNGEQVMHYVRMRKQDPEGDLGRQKRQQQVVRAVIKEIVSLDTLRQLDRILDTLGQNLKTDLTRSDMIALHNNYLAALQNNDSYVVSDTRDLNLYFGYYLYVTEAQRLDLSNHLRALLGLSESQSAIVYPVEFNVPFEYFPVEDYDYDGYYSDTDMLIAPGVYKQSELKTEILNQFGSLPLYLPESSILVPLPNQDVQGYDDSQEIPNNQADIGVEEGWYPEEVPVYEYEGDFY
ncbi:hypothetical protein AWM75_05915 [Aerococcus urinaehominis]|uniref:Uncharacterized protein n=1 Tax=Aerococcus urinaehominis TaxID=128944 RepID=A0A0X8FLM4_9LACT|nr:LCP family protein [Aerococcus urinaehominis]AMB99560.1 hypothetical protein AWM75_05915 [Aerococcus urinaehominis]SDM35170.1 transcriptional attenuator, LytR family [Aerococcus urinaehominis]